jgi:hypothetical protein
MHRRRQRVTMLEPLWEELIDTLPSDALAIYSVVLLVAKGRRQFDANLDEILPLFSEMPRARFDRLIQELADQDLVAMRALSADRTRFFIVREPSGWRPSKDGEEFLRAGRFLN